MRRFVRVSRTLLSLLACLTCARNPQPGATPTAERVETRRLLRDADFVFRGTTVLPRASTIDADEVSDLAIVRVDEILTGAPVFRGLTGQRITVRLRRPADARAGAPSVFFTRGWHYGDDIGVEEIGQLPVVGDARMAALRADVVRAQQEVADVRLHQQADSAELIVAGRVGAIRKADIPRLLTEHDPDWYEADIRVESVIKGRTSGAVVTVLFPNTDDPMWYDAPKLAEGTDGVFLLHRFEFAGQRLPRLVVSRRGDLRPRSDEARIRRLLRQG